MTQSSKKNFKGGLILNKKAVELGLTGFAPVLHMLLSGSAQIKLYTAKSLTGFIFTLNVDESDSVYTNFQRINGGQKITSFIIKIVVIREQKQPLPKFKGIPKSSETESSFLTEARLQQTIWLRNAIGGKPEFTPSVANFALFEEAQSLNVLKCLGTKGDPYTMDVMHYLSRINSLKLGVLLMPMINNSVSLYNYVSNSQISDEQKKTAYCHTIANIVKLFIIVNVVHLDLHPENAMIVSDTQESFLIDFGRASNIRKPINGNHTPDSYLDVSKKSRSYDSAKKHRDTFESMTGPLERQKKRNYTNLQEEQEKQEQQQKEKKSTFMETVCKDLTDLDKRINGERINGEYKDNGSYQMSWMEQIYSSPDKHEIFLCAYEKLKRDYLTDIVSITKNTINSYIKDGKFIDLSRPKHTYYYEFPGEISRSLPELNVPSVSALSLAASRRVPSLHQNAFSSIFENRETPGTYVDTHRRATPGTEETLVDPDEFSTPGTLPDSFSTEEDPPAKQRPRIGGGKTKKKSIKKRKTRKIRSKKTKK